MIRETKTDEYGRVDQSGNKAVEDPHARLMSKLGKILDLKKGATTEAEAATAASVLQRFLDEHNLSIADLERRGQAAPSIEEGHVDLAKAAFGWKLDLAEGIAEFYYCAPLVDRRAKTVAFAGRPDNIQALQMLYTWVIEQVKSIARDARRKHFDETNEHIDPLRWQVSFGEGAVERLIERMRELKARQQEDMARNEYGEVTALALHHASETSDYLEAKYGYRADGKRTKAEQERVERWQREREEKAELEVLCKANNDMEPYYAKYPWERPLSADEQAKRDAEWEERQAEARKREARNAKRRKGTRREAAIDWDKEEQQSTARSSGRTNADKVNLQPFLRGGVAGRKEVE